MKKSYTFMENTNESYVNLNRMLQNSQQSLEYLDFSDNDLDINFLSKFTISQRLNSTDFDKLECIDLSYNYKLKNLNLLGKL